MNVAALIPALNAADTLADVIVRTRAVVPAVWVVDDGSSDATAQVAEEAGATVVRHPVNQGKGAALRTGTDALLRAGVTGVLTLDADGQHLPEELPKLLAACGLSAEGAGTPTADIVLGSRAELFTGMTPYRRFANRVSSRLISFAAGQPLEDIQTGFRFYSQSVLEQLGFPGSRFEAESAVVVLAARRGFQICSTPIRLQVAAGEETSHYRSLQDSLRIARAVFSARFGSLSRTPLREP